VFFTNSGSEAIDTALKMILAYQVARGKASKRMFIARERSYHGVNLGGTAVCGIVSHTRAFGRWAPVDHMPHTLDIAKNSFSRGLPAHGVEKADELERLINLHGAENVAAVLVEPVVGAGGVIPPPIGYLKRLREICDRHDVLLVFDEVVTGFGRLGSFTASIEFAVLPDLFTVAKGLTSGAMPMGAVICSRQIHDTVMAAADGIEFFHGYTYSAHPVACAAALACLDIYEREGLFTRVHHGIGRRFEDVLHGLRGLHGIVDIRNCGLLGAVEFEPQGAAPPLGVQVFAKAWSNGLMIRAVGDTIILSPPLTVGEEHLAEFDDKIRRSIREAGANPQAAPVIRVPVVPGAPSRAAR
jgi:beta-alanine--pyruvate transaminase